MKTSLIDHINGIAIKLNDNLQSGLLVGQLSF